MTDMAEAPAGRDPLKQSALGCDGIGEDDPPEQVWIDERRLRRRCACRRLRERATPVSDSFGSTKRRVLRKCLTEIDRCPQRPMPNQTRPLPHQRASPVRARLILTGDRFSPYFSRNGVNSASITAHSGTVAPVHRAAVVSSVFSNRRRSAIFCRMPSRCARAISRTSRQV